MTEGGLLKAAERVEQLVEIINPHGSRDELLVAVADLLVKYIRWQIRNAGLTNP